MDLAASLRGFLGTLALLGILVAAGLILLWLLQGRLIYLPYPRRLPPAGEVLPGCLELRATTEEGIRLGAWFLPADGEQPGPGVLVLNGNGGNRSLRAPLAAGLARVGVSVLLFDYRGYGENRGRPSETGLLADARAARSLLAGRPEIDPRQMVYFGESLGAALAVALALEHPPAALVLRSPFTSLVDVARVHYPFLPVGPLLRDRYPSLARIGGVRCPVLVIAGGRDGIVPPDQSRRLFDAAPGPKKLVVIPGADHNDWELLAGERLLDETRRFLTEVAGLSLPPAGESAGS